ncbi:unnamed protein product [Dovyalis caffra]|uniref:Uncharacterized protein n=1 Tax=Dovyalis caffra TaxID=77055 RepID=A0AAV1R5P8_9ROSI|nr:unnamed protein product [Dovyalis caffra]
MQNTKVASNARGTPDALRSSDGGLLVKCKKVRPTRAKAIALTFHVGALRMEHGLSRDAVGNGNS